MAKMRDPVMHFRPEGDEKPVCGTEWGIMTPRMTPGFFRVTCKRCIAIAKAREGLK